MKSRTPGAGKLPPQEDGFVTIIEAANILGTTTYKIRLLAGEQGWEVIRPELDRRRRLLKTSDVMAFKQSAVAL